MLTFNEFYTIAQGKWETLDNASQLNEEVIKICYNIYVKNIKGV